MTSMTPAAERDGRMARPEVTGFFHEPTFSVSYLVADPATGRAALIDHLRQAMQRLRAEHEVHVRRAPADLRALLARDAAADADDEVGLAPFQLFPAPQLVEHLFLRLFPYGTGV